LVCYIQKYVIILSGIFPLTSPQPKYWGDVSPASPAGLTPVDPLYTTAATKKSCRGKMPYMINSQSVTDGVSLSVSKSKLVYSSYLIINSH